MSDSTVFMGEDENVDIRIIGDYCPKCMQKIYDYDHCVHCGFTGNTRKLEPHILAPGTMIHDRYYVGNVIGQGGFGITYIGLDSRLGVRVAIKEFYPKGYVSRYIYDSLNLTVPESETNFVKKGISSFLDEARAVAGFYANEGIVNIHDYFEENNTAYMVMEYLDGITLKQYIEKDLFKPDELINLLMPIIESLGVVHDNGFIHRDISPDNIMLLNNGKLKIMDFGAARLMDQSNPKGMSVILKEGYAPEEQYSKKGKQGPWTDVYALCATIYKCITGIDIDDPFTRMSEDTLKKPSEIGIKMDKKVENALMQGLQIHADDRIQNMYELKTAFSGKKTGNSDKKPEKEIKRNDKKENIKKKEKPDTEKNKGGKKGKIILIAIIVLICAGIGIFTDSGKKNNNSNKKESEVASQNNTSGTDATGTTAENNQNAIGIVPPDTTGWDESKKIYVYSWSDELDKNMQHVLEKYPQYKPYYEYINLDCNGSNLEYIENIEGKLNSIRGKYPSIVALDDIVSGALMDKDVAIELKELGITEDVYKNAYPYTIENATYDNKLKGLAWQATPGCVVYRYSIAKEVLGSGEPEDVQRVLMNWDKFTETAELMKNAGYKMISGPDEIEQAFLNSKSSPWTDAAGNIKLDNSVKQYLDLAKLMNYEGYTNGNLKWSKEWENDIKGNVFCYFGCEWWMDSFGSGDMSDWRICEGPSDFYWGGTYLSIMEKSPNKELAAFLVYSLCCDEDILYNIYKDTGDFVNNKNVIEKILNDGLGSRKDIGNQNPILTWKDTAEKLKGRNSSKDYEVAESILSLLKLYCDGSFADADAAISYFYKYLD